MYGVNYIFYLRKKNAFISFKIKPLVLENRNATVSYNRSILVNLKCIVSQQVLPLLRRSNHFVWNNPVVKIFIVHIAQPNSRFFQC